MSKRTIELETSHESIVSPVVHMNGDTITTLQEQLDKVWNCLDTAREALKEASPHGRNYYVKDVRKNHPCTLCDAQEQHTARLLAINILQASIAAEMEAIENLYEK